MSRNPAVILYDTAGNPLAVENGVAVPANTKGTVIHGVDESGDARWPSVNLDPVDSRQRLAIEGKVSFATPPTPPAATTVIIPADTPLEVGPNPVFEETEYVIPDGVRFFMQQISAGAAGDPSENGSKVEVFYEDSGSIRHLVERVYLTGFTQSAIYPDTSQARDATFMDGAAGGNTKIIVRRERLSQSAQEVDAVIRGFTQ